MINYHPLDYGYWVIYVGERYKDVHDIMLKDGTVLRGYYPNATTWHAEGGDGPLVVNDEDVLMIMLVSDDCVSKWRMIGQQRLDYNLKDYNWRMELAWKN